MVPLPSRTASSMARTAPVLTPYLAERSATARSP